MTDCYLSFVVGDQQLAGGLALRLTRHRFAVIVPIGVVASWRLTGCGGEHSVPCTQATGWQTDHLDGQVMPVAEALKVAWARVAQLRQSPARQPA
jgi:hypothetical protein